MQPELNRLVIRRGMSIHLPDLGHCKVVQVIRYKQGGGYRLDLLAQGLPCHRELNLDPAKHRVFFDKEE